MIEAYNKNDIGFIVILPYSLKLIVLCRYQSVFITHSLDRVRAKVKFLVLQSLNLLSWLKPHVKHCMLRSANEWRSCCLHLATKNLMPLNYQILMSSNFMKAHLINFYIFVFNLRWCN